MHKSGRGRERKKESEPDSMLIMEPNMGLYPTTVRSWPEPKPGVGEFTNWATQAPLFSKNFKDIAVASVGEWIHRISYILLKRVQFEIGTLENSLTLSLETTFTYLGICQEKALPSYVRAEIFTVALFHNSKNLK